MEDKEIKSNIITPYKDRVIDFNKNVEVYRCLRKKGKVFTIKQNGIVVGHTSQLKLYNADFVIHKSGQERFKVTGTNNSHAFVRGKINTPNLFIIEERCKLYRVKYNPYNFTTFTYYDGEPCEIFSASYVNFTPEGIYALPIG